MKTAFTSGQLTALTTLLEAKGKDYQGFQSLLSSGVLADIIEADLVNVDREALRKTLGLTPLEMQFFVDCGMTLDQMIAAGSYDWTNSDITAKRFLLSGTGKVAFEPKIFHFDRDISSENAIKEMEKDGFRPAKIEELLAYGAILPDEQRKHPIIALGSVAEIGGFRFVPCLGSFGSERDLDLYWWSGGWLGRYRFLGVRK